MALSRKRYIYQQVRYQEIWEVDINMFLICQSMLSGLEAQVMEIMGQQSFSFFIMVAM